MKDYRNPRPPEKVEILNSKREDFAFTAQEVLGRGKALRFRAKEGSMSSFIRNGDVVEAVPALHRLSEF